MISGKGALLIATSAGCASCAVLIRDPAFLSLLQSLQLGSIVAFACLVASAALLVYATLGSVTQANVSYPATSWPHGKPRFTTSYDLQYDLKDKMGSFERVCDLILTEVLEELEPDYEMPKQEVDWIRNMLEYNMKGGKMNRGTMVVEAGIQLIKFQGGTPTNSDLIRFAVSGWCIEFLQAFLLMADDIMDDSATRRGKPCWYKVEGVQMIAINDFLIVESIVFKLLKRHFGTEPDLLSNMYDLFHETLFQTECGQLIDTRCDGMELQDFTEERWEKQVKYKTSFYSFYLSVAAAMLQVGIRKQATFDAAREILVKMGIYFQAQDDYLDAFGTEEQLGKIGTDIQDKKCSWLFVQAYQKLGDAKSKAVLDAHYGKCKVKTPEEEKVKQVYRDLKLPELWQEYEQNAYDEIMALKSTVKDLPWSIFEIFLKKIFKRDK
eukprot:gnl/MRDRNA2_/MRDRNA2_28986_c0_seq1.p1 gnl/MRDRNA2_/MRDRNA2_28986_c0~~gnl/MRDRNA2_/MRDRNA2_28986_c0_seq1.p1  ORF type:complete len:437 (-),score=94.40 gnl/MRDRNA2_/MRDRNA2_28986_c0_seq1:147-1457(-)